MDYVFGGGKVTLGGGVQVAFMRVFYALCLSPVSGCCICPMLWQQPLWHHPIPARKVQKPMHPALRNSVLQVHRWAGLSLGLPLVFLALTGGGLVFREKLAPLLQAPLYQVGRCPAGLPLDALVARAVAAYPGVGLNQLRIAGPGTPLVVYFADRRQVFIDPCSGQVLGQHARWDGVLNTLEQLHRLRFLQDDDLANVLGGVLALVAVVVFVVGGWVVWWPATLVVFRRSLGLPLHLKGRAFDVNLHRTTGVYATLVLAVVALSAVPLAFISVREGIHLLTRSAPTPPKPLSAPALPGALPVSMQSAWQQAQTRVPGAVRTQLIYPRRKDAALEVVLVAPDAPHLLATSTLFLDAHTGAVLRFTPFAQTSLGNRVYAWVKATHMGYVGGWPGQWLMLLGMLSVPMLGYTGIRSYLRRRFAAKVSPGVLSVWVASIRDEADGVRSFSLARADRRLLPSFAPGAHIDVHIDQGLVRQYSLCGDPHDRSKYLIAVKRSIGSRGGSVAMHERVAVGDVLSISAPRNHFPLRPRARRQLLLAGGIGITPLLSMVHHLLRRGDRFELHYFAGSQAEAPFVAWLLRAELLGKVHFHWGLSPSGVARRLAGLLDPYVAGDQLYVCGPGPFMAAVQAAAQPAWPQQAVHVEHFAADPSAFAGERRPFAVRLARSGTRFDVPADKSILEVLRAEGSAVPYACEQGVCGTCLTAVIEGTPDHRDSFLSPGERQAGKKIMLCVSRAKTPELVLDL